MTQSRCLHAGPVLAGQAGIYLKKKIDRGTLFKKLWYRFYKVHVPKYVSYFELACIHNRHYCASYIFIFYPECVRPTSGQSTIFLLSALI